MPCCARVANAVKSRPIYTTPAGEKRRIAVTVSPVPAVDGSLLGAACLISDRSEFEQIRHQQQLHGEISAEMALELRTSLSHDCRICPAVGAES